MKLIIRPKENFLRAAHSYLFDIAVLLAIPAFLLLLHAFTRGLSFMFNDNLLFFGNEYNIIQMLHDGIFPVRDPYLYIDLIRTSEGSPLYWPHALYHFVGARFFANDVETLRVIWTGIHITHYCLPSVAMYFLLRYLKLSRVAAISGAVIYGWNFYMALMGGIYAADNRLVHIAVIPAVWLIAVYSLDSKKYYLNILSGLLAGWAILAGGLQPVIYVMPFLLSYLFVRLIIDNPLTVKNTLCAAAMPLMIILIVALCILPVVMTAPDILPYFERARNIDDRFHRMFFLKDFFKAFLEPFAQWGIRGSYTPWESVRYFGLLPIPLFLIGSVVFLIGRFRRNKLIEIWFFGIFVIAFSISIFYSYFPRWLFQLMMFQKGFTRYPFRFYFLAMFGVSFFAAKGLDWINCGKARKRMITKWLFWGSLAVLALLIVIKIGMHRPVIGTDAFFYSSSLIALISMAALLFVYMKPGFRWLIPLLITLDLGLVSYVYCGNRYQAMDHITKDWYNECFLRVKDQGWIKKLPKTEIPYRVKVFAFGEGRRGASNREMGYVYNKIREPFGYGGSIGIARLLDFCETINGFHPIYSILGVRFFCLSKDQYKGGAKTAGGDEEGMLLYNDYALPLIFPRTNAKIFNTDDELLAALRKGDNEIRRLVYFSRQDLKGDADLLNQFYQTDKDYQEPDVKISAVNYKPDKVEFLAFVQRDTIMVLSEPWLPPWRALIDGKITRIYQAYGIIQAIIIPKGTHSVRFEYTFPRHLIYVSCAGQLAALLFVLFFALRSRKTRP